MVTVPFVSSEELASPTVEIEGVLVSAVEADTENHYVANRTMLGTDPQGLIFVAVIAPTDLAGNAVSDVGRVSEVTFGMCHPNAVAGLACQPAMQTARRRACPSRPTETARP